MVIRKTVWYYIMNESLIKLDEYLDLSNLELVNKEFIDSIHKVPKKYIEE